MKNPYLQLIRPEWLDEIRANSVVCEARRPFTRKPAKTGTISEAACLYLRAIVEQHDPKVCVEIGTFIGTSALILASRGASVYTCDKDNAAFESQGTIEAFGETSSTTMLDTLELSLDVCSGRGVGFALMRVVDLWFFDGRIQVEDLPFICRFSGPKTVFAFDDYERREKGVINVERLTAYLGDKIGTRRLTPPPARVLDLPSQTTIAVLAPV